jgi:branched-chain amino acid transport system permease protein
MPTSNRLVTGVLAVAGAAVLVVAPTFLDLYWMRLVTYALMFAAMSSGLNITAGFTGYPAFGDVVWFGLGSTLTAALMAKAHWAFAAAVPVAVVFCSALAAFVGPALLRLRGHYFAIGTLALNEATRALVQNNPGRLTGGSFGLSVPLTTGSAESTARFFYYLFFGALVLAVGISLLLVRTRVGYGLRAIRADEDAAASLGVNTTLLKTVAWTLSASLIGLTGAIYAYFINYIDPPGVFDIGVSIKMFVIVLLGGVGTVFGPVIGAFGIQILETEVISNFFSYHLMIFGGIVIAIVLFLPSGLVTFARRRTRELVALFAR